MSLLHFDVLHFLCCGVRGARLKAQVAFTNGTLTYAGIRTVHSAVGVWLVAWGTLLTFWPCGVVHTTLTHTSTPPSTGLVQSLVKTTALGVVVTVTAWGEGKRVGLKYIQHGLIPNTLYKQTENYSNKCVKYIDMPTLWVTLTWERLKNRTVWVSDTHEFLIIFYSSFHLMWQMSLKNKYWQACYIEKGAGDIRQWQDKK